jgi:uncharacterized protein (DUF427 family)
MHHRRMHHLALIASPKRVRVAINGKTVAGSLCAGPLLENERFPSTHFGAKMSART